MPAPHYICSPSPLRAAACVFLSLAIMPVCPPLHATNADVTVSAAISMKDALDAIARLYQAQSPGSSIHFNFGASGTLQRQIEQGAPVDVFISASPAEMNGLESKNLILRSTRRDLVRNSVVLITPRGRNRISGFQDLLQPAVKVIAIGNPQSVPAGKYAEEGLAYFGLWHRLEPKIVFANDVRQVLTYVATGNADAGIVYATDARASSEVSVVAVAPDTSHDPVVYPVAVIAGSKDLQGAKSFERFLFGPDSTRVFEQYGFESGHSR